MAAQRFIPGDEVNALAPFSPVSPCDRVPSYALGSEKFKALALMIQTLLGKNAIVEMKPGETGFFNLVFLRPKKHEVNESKLDKRWRLILD